MFENLQDKLDRAFKVLKGQGSITEINVAETMKEIRKALLDADVNYKTAKAFTDDVKEKALGLNVLTSISPGQLLTKLMNDELAALMGGAVEELTISANPTIILIAGLNGAGKTTLFNTITGLQPLTSGKIVFNGKDVTKEPPHKRTRMGLARTFQRLELFTSLSVRDNVRVAGEIRNRWSFRTTRMDVNAETDRIIQLVGLADVADREVGEIPTGQARVVELARALMIQPTLLLLDEPASGQTEEETEQFGELLKDLARNDGLGICLVEHDMALVMKVCETIHVLDFGTIISSGTAEYVRNDPTVIDAYLGSPESVG